MNTNLGANTISVGPSKQISGSGTTNEKSKQWQMELLMERLRGKQTQQRTFAELSKSMRMSMLEKRYSLDIVEKSNLQKCLDNMQHCIKVTTKQGLIERLESLSRQLGLKLMEDTSGIFISSDMFYLEIILDANGSVHDVKVHHECKIEQQSCVELVNCLVKGDFADFTAQLEGLVSIYQLNAEPKIKSKAFVALQALEVDISTLFSAENFCEDLMDTVSHSTVGLVQKRRGGHPMKITYFIPPYDLLNLDNKSMNSLSLDLLNAKPLLGMSVTVNLEASPANKLQIVPLTSLTKDAQGATTPIYTTLGPHNSIMLPATFVLRLNKPMPISMGLVEQIRKIIDFNFEEASVSVSILNLITKHASVGQIESSSKGLFVTLPDQNHCYFMTDTNNIKGILISMVPFTEASQVPKIIKILRQQSLFNTLISSCVRMTGKQDIENTTMLEVSALSSQHIAVTLEHPFKESMTTVEFFLMSNSTISFKIFSLNSNYDEFIGKLSKIATKSLSIPVTLRALLLCWERQHHQDHQIGNRNFHLPHPNDSSDLDGASEYRDLKAVIKSERNDFNGRNTTFQSTGNGGGGASDGHSTDCFPEHRLFNVNNDTEMSVMLKSNAIGRDIGFIDEQAIKRRRTQDFWTSPKSECINDAVLMNTATSNDSISLGNMVERKSDSQGVVTNDQKTIGKCATKEGQNEQTLLINSKDGEPNQTRVVSVLKFSDDEKKDAAIDDKKLSVSITPIASSSGISSVLTGLEKRLGIEIIPIQSHPAPNLKSSITITPIGSANKLIDKSKCLVPKSKSADDRIKSEKKRRRKREENHMGPPEKISAKSGSGLAKTGGFSGLTGTDCFDKYSAEKNGLFMNADGKNVFSTHSSPKHHMSSPKQQAGSGKPSMLTLKTATNSPEYKSTEKLTKSRDRSSDRDKERPMKHSSNSSSPKLKSSSVKLKHIDFTTALLPNVDGTLDSLTLGQDKSAQAQKIRSKGSLSAVIDKLKSAQSVGDDQLSDGHIALSKIDADTSSIMKSSEYMVKPSSYGIKITINKTKKELFPTGTGKSSSPSKSSTKTGLKPGVNSGPASKKPQSPFTQISSSKSMSAISSSIKHTGFQRSNSSGNLTTPKSSSTSPRSTPSSSSIGHSDIFKKSKNKLTLPKSDKQMRCDAVDVLKMLSYSAKGQPMDGFIKGLDTKFQIPKLSARTIDDPMKRKPQTQELIACSSSTVTEKSADPIKTGNPDAAAKMIMDLFAKEKFPFSLSKYSGPETTTSVQAAKSSPITVANITKLSTFEPDIPAIQSNVLNSASDKSKDLKIDPPNFVSIKSIPTTEIPSTPIDLDMQKSIKQTVDPLSQAMKPPSAPDRALDYTKATNPTTTISATIPPDTNDTNTIQSSSKLVEHRPIQLISATNRKTLQSSVQMHIVKSPVPSPLVIIPSPHSNSTNSCITDDELMDETAVGGGK